MKTHIMEFTLNVQATGDFTEEELKEYLLHCMGFGACDLENPFVSEDYEAEITDIKLD